MSGVRAVTNVGGIGFGCLGTDLTVSRRGGSVGGEEGERPSPGSETRRGGGGDWGRRSKSDRCGYRMPTTSRRLFRLIGEAWIDDAPALRGPAGRVVVVLRLGCRASSTVLRPQCAIGHPPNPHDFDDLLAWIAVCIRSTCRRRPGPAETVTTTNGTAAQPQTPLACTAGVYDEEAT